MIRPRPFDVTRDHVRLRAGMRTPILCMGAHARATFSCYEQQRRVECTLRSRFREHELARTDDAFVLDYAVSRCMHATNLAGGCVVDTLDSTCRRYLPTCNLRPVPTVRSWTDCAGSPAPW